MPYLRAKHIPLLIALATFLIYLPAVFENAFVNLDDVALITHNPAVQGITFENLRTIFTTYDPELYVPLTLLTYQIEASIVGMHPWIFHLTNLLLHSGSVLILFGLIRKIASQLEWSEHRGTLLAIFVAILFALHPLNTETVVWAAARKDVLSGFLVLLSLSAFLQYRVLQKNSLYAWSLVLFALALLAKASVLAVPFALILIEILTRKRLSKTLQEFIPFGALAILFGIIALFGKTTNIRELTLFEHFLIACKASSFYILKFLWPSELSVYEPQLTPIALNTAEFIVPMLVVLVVAALAVVLWKRFPLFTFGLCLFFLAIAPSFGNVWKNGVLYFASDRYAYIGGIGLACAVGAFLIPWLSTVPKRTSIVGLVTLAVFLGYLSYEQAATWRDSIAIYERALAVHSTFAVAMNNLGGSLYEEGRTEEAWQQYQHAVALNPELVIVHNNIGRMLRKDGDIEGALKEYQTAVAAIPADRPLLPDDVVAFGLLAQQLDELGRTEEALTTFGEAAERAPENADAQYNYAIMLQKYRRYPEAHEYFLNYLELRPRNLEVRYRLAAVEAEMGLLKEAAENLEIIVERNPEYEQASKHLESIRKILQQ